MHDKKTWITEYQGEYYLGELFDFLKPTDTGDRVVAWMRLRARGYQLHDKQHTLLQQAIKRRWWLVIDWYVKEYCERVDSELVNILYDCSTNSKLEVLQRIQNTLDTIPHISPLILCQTTHHNNNRVHAWYHSFCEENSIVVDKLSEQVITDKAMKILTEWTQHNQQQALEKFQEEMREWFKTDCIRFFENAQDNPEIIEELQGNLKSYFLKYDLQWLQEFIERYC